VQELRVQTPDLSLYSRDLKHFFKKIEIVDTSVHHLAFKS
jgi:hypothetical protein